MNELISIIVPIYGAEPYLRRCIDSILGQTYSNLEVILVDDESPDQSGKICDEYKFKDDRVKVIHQKNAGAAGARNSGIEVAKGRYIAFADPDDFISENMLEYLYKAINENDADISVCNFRKFPEDSKIVEENFLYDSLEKNMIISEDDRIKYMFLEKYVDSIIFWNKLYKKELWEKEKIPLIRAYEDEAVLYKILDNADRIVYLDGELYYYMIRKSGSITTQDFSEKRLLRLEVLKNRMDYYLRNKKWNYFIEMLFVYKTDLLKVMELIEDSGKFSISIISKYQKIYRKYCLKYLLIHSKNLKNTITHLWFAWMPQLYYRRYRDKI